MITKKLRAFTDKMEDGSGGPSPQAWRTERESTTPHHRSLEPFQAEHGMLSMPAASSNLACCKLLADNIQVQLVLMRLSSSWLFAVIVRLMQCHPETAILLI